MSYLYSYSDYLHIKLDSYFPSDCHGVPVGRSRRMVLSINNTLQSSSTSNLNMPLLNSNQGTMTTSLLLLPLAKKKDRGKTTKIAKISVNSYHINNSLQRKRKQ